MRFYIIEPDSIMNLKAGICFPTCHSLKWHANYRNFEYVRFCITESRAPVIIQNLA